MKKYNWEPTSSAPLLFPVEFHAAYMRYGNNSALAVPSSMRINNGLGTPGLTYGLNDEGSYPLPTGLDIVWLSLVDKKFYRAEVDFPMDTLTSLFDKGYINGKGEREYYNMVNVGLIPGGRIIIYLDGGEKRVELCDFQGEETMVNMKDFLPNAYFAYENYDAYFQEVFSDDDDWILNYKTNGVPYDLWDRYRERFNYDINFEFENKASRPNGSAYGFANKERCNINQYNPAISIRPTSPIRLINTGWIVDGYEYSAWFYFNEQEVLRVFDEAYGDDREQKGELRILVSKYNNLFDISLRVAGKVYPLKATQIRVFKQRPGEDDKYAVLIYKNYEDAHTKFIGQ